MANLIVEIDFGARGRFGSGNIALLEKVGGKRGERTATTPFGKKVIALYRSIERSATNAAKANLAALANSDVPPVAFILPKRSRAVD